MQEKGTEEAILKQRNKTFNKTNRLSTSMRKTWQQKGTTHIMWRQTLGFYMSITKHLHTTPEETSIAQLGKALLGKTTVGFQRINAHTHTHPPAHVVHQPHTHRGGP